jgi:hypothetical protein
LEVTTIAYIVISGILYGIWWKKPKGVRYPIGVELTGGDHEEMYLTAGNEKLRNKDLLMSSLDFLVTAGEGSYDITASHAVPTFYSGRGDKLLIGTATEMVLGCIFGIIHCITWSFEF